MDYFDSVIQLPKSPYDGQSFRVEWQRAGMPQAATEVKWPACVLDGDLDAPWQSLTALDWHAIYPYDRRWRDAAVLSLSRLAHAIATKLTKSSRREGADVFSVGLLAIMENIDDEVPAKVWPYLIERRMLDYLRRENRSADVTHLQRIYDAYAARTECREPWRELVVYEVDNALQSCLTTDRRRDIFKLKDRGYGEQEIGEILDIGRGAVQHTVRQVYSEVCEKLGIAPMRRKTRAFRHNKKPA